MLTRRTGNPIHATTRDVGVGGMRIVSDRPLSVDEELEYDLLPSAERRRHGRARVVRQQTMDCYALRFELAVDDILATLQGMSMNDAATAPLLDEMLDSVLAHIDEEEKQFFPQLQHAAIDMTPIGLEMQAFEANMVHLQAQISDQAARR